MSQPRDITGTIGEELARRLTDLDITIDTQHPEWDGETIRARVAWVHFARLVLMAEQAITLAIHQNGRIEAEFYTQLGPVCFYTQITGGPDDPIVVDI